MNRKGVRLTKLELEIMDYLWDLTEASVREIQERIPEKKRPAYTTVQTILQRLEQKGAVARTRKIGNAFLYEPLVSRMSAYKRRIDELLDLFGGSAGPLVAHLVDTGRLSLEDVREMEQRLARKDSPEPAED